MKYAADDCIINLWYRNTGKKFVIDWTTMASQSRVTYASLTVVHRCSYFSSYYEKLASGTTRSRACERNFEVVCGRSRCQFVCCTHTPLIGRLYINCRTTKPALIARRIDIRTVHTTTDRQTNRQRAMHCNTDASGRRTKQWHSCTGGTGTIR
jgi:hypothetical protein